MISTGWAASIRTRHRQTVFSLEGGDGGGGLRAVNAVGDDAQVGGVILGNDPEHGL